MPPTAKEIREKEDDLQQKLDRARLILGIYYGLLPLLLVYLLFKIFPPTPWPSEPYVRILFAFGKWEVWTTLEERLLLLVVVAGALGSYIHSATSYSDYRGNQQFFPSWLLWYLLRPLIGVCLALVVYFAMRGGLLSIVLSGAASTAATEAKNINPFGVAAISGLVGMFSKQAADKLAEVFTTLFRSGGDTNRKDSLVAAPAPVITLIAPKEGPEAGQTSVVITGTGFVADAIIAFGENAATNVTVVNDTTITAETPPGAGVVDLTVLNADGQKAIAPLAYTYLGGGNGGGAEGGAGTGATGAGGGGEGGTGPGAGGGGNGDTGPGADGGGNGETGPGAGGADAGDGGTTGAADALAGNDGGRPDTPDENVPTAQGGAV